MINKLLNPKKFHDPILLADLDGDELKQMLKKMIIIMYFQQDIKTKQKNKLFFYFLIVDT